MVPRVAVLKDVNLSSIELYFCSVYCIVKGRIQIIEVEFCGQKMQISFC